MLIPTFNGQIGDTPQLLVNARDLHAFLEVGRDFSNWIKARIFDYDFQENQDYVVFANFGENPQGGRPTTDYHLTLDMAKELSMVERNSKGKQARRYFIDCEKRLQQSPSTATDPLAHIAHTIQQMADGMAVLAKASQTQLKQLDRTADYINLLELNQKGHIKVTSEVIEQVKLMKSQGYPQASIGRLLRLSGATVSLIVNDKYPMKQVASDERVSRLITTAKNVLADQEQEQGE